MAHNPSGKPLAQTIQFANFVLAISIDGSWRTPNSFASAVVAGPFLRHPRN
jgi:hypothetical protein